MGLEENFLFSDCRSIIAWPSILLLFPLLLLFLFSLRVVCPILSTFSSSYLRILGLSELAGLVSELVPSSLGLELSW
jgi:hypothetical protein